MDPLGIVQVQRSLVDPKPDVRTSATQLVANRSVAVFKDVPFDRACGILGQQCDVVDSQFLKVASPTYRRGGLLCVRGILTGIPSREYPDALVARFCELVLPAVADLDLSVRLAAAETCHELIQRFNFQLLHAHLTKFFVAMARLVSDPDRKIALIGQEVSATAREYVCGSEIFHVNTATFVGVVATTLTPFGRAGAAVGTPETTAALWAVEWTQHVAALVGRPLVPFTDTLVAALLPLTRFAALVDAVNRLLRTLREGFMTTLGGSASLPATSVDAVLGVLCAALESEDTAAETASFCLNWLHALVTTPSCRTVIIARAPLLLAVSLAHVTLGSDRSRADVRALLDALSRAVIADEGATVALPVLMQTLQRFLSLEATRETCVEVQTTCLQWVALVDRCVQKASLDLSLDALVTGVLTLLCRTTSSAVVDAAVSTLDLLIAPADRPQQLVAQLLAHTQRDPHRLLPRLPQIAVVMHADATRSDAVTPIASEEVDASVSVLMGFARALQMCDDLRFVSKAVMTLNGALLTFPEFADTRQALRASGHSAAFTELAATWRYHAVSLLSLALLCGCDESALAVVRVLGSAELSPATLLQLDRFVQLLESPAFIPLRCRLADPVDCPSLVRALFAILSLLPQTSPQYAALRERCTMSGAMLQWQNPPPARGAAPPGEDDRQDGAAIGVALAEAMKALAKQEQQL